MSKSKFIGGYSINLKVGIIGTTNVGKSTLFNLLSRSTINTALCSPALFCTVDPNISIFDTMDSRFDYIVDITKPQIQSCSKITLIDSSGLVDGSFSEVVIIKVMFIATIA
jgi:ribosome-binding ATPase YchF (GTP1/OBG family)